MIGCGFLEVFPVKLRNMERLVVKLLVGKINFLLWRLRNPVGDFYIVWGILLWCSLPDSDSLGPDSDSLENDFPPGGLLYIMGDFHITWGIFT